MPSNFTEHYQLNQWSPGDQVLREDFNADNAKLDAVLAGKVGIITGSYLGDQAASRFIDLGATPKAVLLFTSNGYTHDSAGAYGGLALPGYPVKNGSYLVCEIVEGGFMVYYKKDFALSNANNTRHYLAFV